MNLFTRTLMEWYARHGRDLPWRNTADPYRIWVSEIILQQTRVAQGYDYYLRFVQRFPDVGTLAAATEEEVLRYWQGLGYYSRARNLHAAARNMEGHFPTTYQGVLALKGVGEYTAAAICSIAYGMPYAVVDGNVQRVLARYFGISEPADTAKGKKAFRAVADEMLHPSRPGDYNQAIMDFGALQCTPSSPDCAGCPLIETCHAARHGCVAQLPAKKRKPQTTDRYFCYLLVRTGDRILLHKRTGDDIWQGLYELPLVESGRVWTEDELCASPAYRSYFPEGEVPQKVRAVQKGVRHVLSHQVIHADFYEVLLPEESAAFTGCLRVPAWEVGQYAMPRLVQRFLEGHL